MGIPSQTAHPVQRGRRYGLCGANGVGKSTLMRAIAANKVDGFPPPDQLRTVYVEHDIQVGGLCCSFTFFVWFFVRELQFCKG